MRGDNNSREREKITRTDLEFWMGQISRNVGEV